MTSGAVAVMVLNYLRKYGLMDAANETMTMMDELGITYTTIKL